MPTDLRYGTPREATTDADTIVLVGRAERLRQSDVRELAVGVSDTIWNGLLDAASNGDDGGSATTFVERGDSTVRVVVAALPGPGTHYNSPSRPHAAADLVRGAIGKGKTAVLIVPSEASHGFALGCAVARACPLYNRKGSSPENSVAVGFVGHDVDLDRVRAAAKGIRVAGRLVDMPTSELTTTAFAAEARRLVDDTPARCEQIQGEELERRGFGGLWNVGKTAEEKPALVILRYEPKGATQHVAWVGKGIVYDTGGLSIKTRGNMAGMKCDMGGAAAVMGAFVAAMEQKPNVAITALLCLAENAVGPSAYRPDDIITLYSGKTVEINNTDAEGRLVLGDGVAYASKHLSPDVIVDLATLTGAQLIATGKRHASIVCNDPELEAQAVAAGRVTGDLVHPLPWVPEFFRNEFKSKIADLKNSVKDRMNAQTSCAGQFVAEHLVDYDKKWLHIDLAGPAFIDERGTGYGVALLMELFGV